MTLVSISSDGGAGGDAAGGEAADGDAGGGGAAGGEAADMEDKSNTSDVGLDGLPRFEAEVRQSTAAARAVAASADFLNVSTASSTIASGEASEEMEVSKFTALTEGEPSMTSSPRKVRYSERVEYRTKSYADFDWSSGDLTSTSGDDPYNPDDA